MGGRVLYELYEGRCILGRARGEGLGVRVRG